MRRQAFRPRKMRACTPSASRPQFQRVSCAERRLRLSHPTSATGTSTRYIICLTESSKMGRTIVIGDIHGCFDELKDLLVLVEMRTNDQVIAVGDLIVKGEKNREVLDLFIDDYRFSSVIGNHDRALRQYWRGEPIRLTKDQKAAAVQLQSERERYAAYLRSLPFTINLGSHLIVHPGVRPGVPLRRQMASDLTKIRTMGANPSSRRGIRWYEVYRGRKIV